MEINLNNEEYKSKEFVAFNDGVAGVVCGVRFRVEKKKAEDADGAPDYNVIFVDKVGAEVKKAFWYITQESMERNPKSLTTQGKLILHMWHAVNGKAKDVPKFSNPIDMLDQTMAMLREASRFTANVVVDYGDDFKHESFITVARFAPFMEVDVDASSTKLYLGKKVKTERLIKDSPEELFSGGIADSGKPEVKWDFPSQN